MTLHPMYHRRRWPLVLLLCLLIAATLPAQTPPARAVEQAPQTSTHSSAPSISSAAQPQPARMVGVLHQVLNILQRITPTATPPTVAPELPSVQTPSPALPSTQGPAPGGVFKQYSASRGMNLDLDFNGMPGTQFPFGCYKLTIHPPYRSTDAEVLYVPAVFYGQIKPMHVDIAHEYSSWDFVVIWSPQAFVQEDGSTISGAASRTPFGSVVTVESVNSIPTEPGNPRGIGCAVLPGMQQAPPASGCGDGATPQNAPGGPNAVTGDPIDLSSGTLVLNIPCLTLGGAGLPINVGLHYSSRAASEGRSYSGIGRGWFVGQNRSLIATHPVPDCTSTGGSTTCTALPPQWYLATEDGTIYPFIANDSSETTFRSPTGSNLTLTRDATTGQATITYRNGQRDTFNAAGERIRSEDRFGNALTYVFDRTTGVQTITNLRTGQALRLEHSIVNGAWRLNRIADAATNGSPTRQVLLGYDSAGNLSSVTDAAGRRQTFGYDEQHRIISVYDANNNPAVLGASAHATQITYSQYFPDMVTRQVLANGTTIDLEYTGAGVNVTYQAGTADASTVAYGWGEYGTISSISLPNRTNVASTYQYNDQGRLVESRDPLGRRIRYGYDSYSSTSYGDLKSITVYNGSTGNTTAYAFDGYGAITLRSEPTGERTEWSYSPTTGALTSVANKASASDPGHSTQVETNASGQITKVILPDGTRNTLEYDALGYPARLTYDANVDGLSGRLALSEETVYSWRGDLLRSTDLRGIQTAYEYAQNASAGQFGAVGLPSAKIEDAAGRQVRTTWTYDAMVNVLRQVDDAGSDYFNRTTQATYAMVGANAEYAPTAITDPLGQVTRLTYSPLGDITAMIQVGANTDGSNRVTHFAVTPEGWPASTTLHDGRVVETIDYNDAGQPVRITDAAGVQTAYTYDGKGRLAQQVYGKPPINIALGKSATQSSDYDSQRTASKAVDGNFSGSWAAIASTQNEPEAWWQVDLGSSQAIDIIKLWNRSDCCQDRLSNVVVFVSDTPFTNTSVAATQAQSGVSTYTLSGALGTATSVPINRSGRYVRVQLTEANLLSLAEVEVLQADDVLPEVTSYSYDNSDRLTSISASIDVNTTRTLEERHYDGYGRLDWIKDGAGNQTTLSYDSRDRVIAQISGINNTAQQVKFAYAYDAVDRLTQEVVDPGTGQLNLAKAYRYSIADSTDRWSLQQVVDAHGNSTTYSYNTLGQVNHVTDALGSDWIYRYDRLGRFRSVIPPVGAPTVYTTDLLGRVTNVTRNGDTEVWTYNTDGTVASATDFAGHVTDYGYDSTGRLVSIDRGSTSADAQFTYTANDLLASATSMPDGVTSETTTYSYDTANRLRSRTRSGRTLTYTYNQAGDLTSLQYWNRGSVTYSYDAAGRLSNLTPWGGAPSSYSYRSTGQLASIARPTSNSIQSIYGYDTAGRLNSIAHTRGTTNINTIGYQLDANGNRTRMTDQWGTTTYQYDALNRLTKATLPAISGGPAAQTANYTYDAVGNRTSAPGIGTLTYDASDRIDTSVHTGYNYNSNGSLRRTPDATYNYDYANRLVRTITARAGTTYYQYDALGNLVRQIDGNGVATDFVLDESGALPLVVGEIKGNTQTLYAYGAEGLHAERQWIGNTAQGMLYPLNDGLGNVRNITSANGAVTRSISYDAWGVLRYATGSAPSAAYGLGYTSEQHFSDGVVNLRARAYIPALGRFLQRDSFAGFTARPQSLNRYAYVEGNPTNWIDPSGYTATQTGSGTPTTAAPAPQANGTGPGSGTNSLTPGFIAKTVGIVGTAAVL